MGRVLIPAILLSLACAAAPAATSDDFNNNAIDSQWTLIQDNPTDLSLSETSQRLEVLATGAAGSSDDALYLSNGLGGFRMSTAADFALSIDYNVTGVSGTGLFALDFGVGTDATGDNSAAIGYAPSTGLGGGVAVASRTANVQTTYAVAALLDATYQAGTMTLSYSPATDTLTLQVKDQSLDLPGLVGGAWGADGLFVSFGGRGSGVALSAGQAYFDNFEVLSGTVLPVPEPGTLALLSFGMAAILRRRRARR